jgi:hypothetical protein
MSALIAWNTPPDSGAVVKAYIIEVGSHALVLFAAIEAQLLYATPGGYRRYAPMIYLRICCVCSDCSWKVVRRAEWAKCVQIS